MCVSPGINAFDRNGAMRLYVLGQRTSRAGGERKLMIGFLDPFLDKTSMQTWHFSC